MSYLLSFGHGYSACAFAKLLDGWTIQGTHRDREIVWPGTDIRPHLDQATHLLISTAPGPDGDPVLAELREEITARAARFKWVGYLSTTGVYGDRNGNWVDENSPLNPATKRGIARVRAETEWQSIPDLPIHIFRLAGIYGPGRGPFAKVRAGTARRIIKQGQIFSRIHVDDIAQTLRASTQQPNPGAIYNVCDDDPQPPQVVIEAAARMLGLQPPPEEAFETAQMTPMARSFYAESKKVSNRRIREELGVNLLYPDYQTGLAAVLKSETAES